MIFIDCNQAFKSGFWTEESDKSGFWTKDQKAQILFQFTGKKAYVIGTFDPNHGIIDVSVDGNVTSVDTNLPERKMESILFETEDLRNVRHNIQTRTGDSSDGNQWFYYLSNDGRGMIEMESISINVSKSEFAIVNLKRIGGHSGEVGIRVCTTDGTAIVGMNYYKMDDTTYFKDGESAKEVMIKTFDYRESGSKYNLQFAASISNPTNNAIVGFTKSSTIDIIYKDTFPAGLGIIHSKDSLFNSGRSSSDGGLSTNKGGETMLFDFYGSKLWIIGTLGPNKGRFNSCIKCVRVSI